MKKIATIYLIFSLLLLCACSSAQVPTDLTAPPTEPPTTLSPKEEALEGIGTICDIAAYQGQILLLTHTGLYTVDRNLENLQFLDDLCNKPFEEFEQDTFFDRLCFEPNYDDPYFDELIATNKGILYYCNATETYYFNGEPFEFRIREQLRNGEALGELVDMTTYNGVLFTSWKRPFLYSTEDYVVLRENEIIEGCPGGKFVHVNEQLYIVHTFADLEFGADGEVVGSASGRYLIELDEDGSFRASEYSLEDFGLNEATHQVPFGEYLYSILYTGGDSVEGEEEPLKLTLRRRDRDGKGGFENLDCQKLDGESTNLYRWFLLDENHLVYLIYGGRLEIAEFSVEQN